MAPDHQQPPQPPKKNVDQHRKLRIVAICTFIPALALLLPCGIISGKPLPTIGIAPMFFSAAFQAATINGRPRLPKTTFCINVFLAAFLFSILLPSWIFMAEGRLSNWHRDGLVMLGTYGTMPMMLNFVIHLYLALRGFPSISWSRRVLPVCCCDNPTCCSRRRPEDKIQIFAGGNGKDDEVHQPMMIGFYDEDARPSDEFQTSGFNTPRVSQETLESSERRSGELV